MHCRGSTTQLHYVFKGGRNVVANHLTEVMATIRTRASLLVHDPASSALRVQRVPACAFHLSSVDADTAVAPAFIQTAQANAAHGFFKIIEAGRSSLGDGSGCKL